MSMKVSPPPLLPAAAANKTIIKGEPVGHRDAPNVAVAGHVEEGAEHAHAISHVPVYNLLGAEAGREQKKKRTQEVLEGGGLPVCSTAYLCFVYTATNFLSRSVRKTGTNVRAWYVSCELDKTGGCYFIKSRAMCVTRHFRSTGMNICSHHTNHNDKNTYLCEKHNKRPQLVFDACFSPSRIDSSGPRICVS